jgi:hypothetical protein
MDTKHLYLILILAFTGAAFGGYVGTSQLMTTEPSDTDELRFISLTLDDNHIVRGSNTTLHIGRENTSPTPKAARARTTSTTSIP